MLHELCEVRQTNLNGNSIFSIHDINAGDPVILNELPYLWNKHTSYIQEGSCVYPRVNLYSSCEQCGITINIQELYDNLSKEIKNYFPIATELTQVLLELSQVISNISYLFPSAFPCHESCGSMYCSALCRDLAVASGHEFICNPDDALMKKLIGSNNDRSHSSLAIRFYAKLAKNIVLNLSSLGLDSDCHHSHSDNNNVVSNDKTSNNININNNEAVVDDNSIVTETDISLLVMEISENMLSKFHNEDFTRTIHCYRTGQSPVDINPNIFEELIFPAYFSAHLQEPLLLCKQILNDDSNIMLWGEGDHSLGTQRLSQFMSSDVFSDHYISKIIGTFAVNCLDISIPSPMDDVYKHLLSSYDNNTGTGVNEDIEGLIAPFLLNDSKLYHFLRQYWSGIVHAPSNLVFDGLHGSGLYSSFSKMNHSCDCNTVSQGSNLASVTVIARRDIATNEEITTSYIHDNTANHNSTSANMTKKMRHRELRQYLFECDCLKCQNENNDDDSDGSYE
eukprot:gene12949-17363_t